jgi:hypothetical protein
MRRLEQVSSSAHSAIARAVHAAKMLGPELASTLASLAGPTKLGGALHATATNARAVHPR